jgi:hypothetical protein
MRTAPPESVIDAEITSECHPVGHDPRKMEPNELRALGHMQMTPLAALRLRCLDCCGEVRPPRSESARRSPALLGLFAWARTPGALRLATPKRLGDGIS